MDDNCVRKWFHDLAQCRQQPGVDLHCGHMPGLNSQFAREAAQTGTNLQHFISGGHPGDVNDLLQNLLIAKEILPKALSGVQIAFVEEFSWVDWG